MFSEIMDDGLGSLACLMALSAMVASLVTWLLTRKFGGATEAVVRKLPVAAESDEEIWSETETVSVPLDTTRKYYVSSSGRKVHLFADCLGSNARVSYYQMCVLCADRFSDRPSSSSTTRRRRSNSKRG